MFKLRKTMLNISASLLTFSLLVPSMGYAASKLQKELRKTFDVEETYSKLEEESTEEKMVILEEQYFVPDAITGELIPKDTVTPGEIRPLNTLEPGIGSVRVSTYAIGGGSSVFSQEKGGIYEQISGIAFYLLGKYAGTVGTFISDLVSAWSSSLNKKSYVTAQTGSLQRCK